MSVDDVLSDNALAERRWKKNYNYFVRGLDDNCVSDISVYRSNVSL